MPTYKVIRKSDQAEVYRYAAASIIEFPGYEFATHEHVEFNPDTTVAPTGPRHVTKLAFRSRFTANERAAITFAARQNTVQGAAVQAYLDDVQAATFIDLDRPDTRAGVQSLEAAGLLAGGRALTILDAEITEQEVYRA